jgi:hypothetical protein
MDILGIFILKNSGMELIKATEMLKITVENQVSIENIVKNCEERAKQGWSELTIFSYLSTERISDLANLGYRIEKNYSQMQETTYRISWA